MITVQLLTIENKELCEVGIPEAYCFKGLPGVIIFKGNYYVKVPKEHIYVEKVAFCATYETPVNNV